MNFVIPQKEIERLIKKYPQKGFSPVRSSGRYWTLQFDITQNGYNDLFVLYIKSPSGRVMSIKEITQFSSLFDDNKEAYDCYLQVFLNNRELTPKHWINLGNKKVISTFKKISLRKENQFPCGISMGYQTINGSGEDWIIFINPESYTRFTLKDTYNENFDVQDIDYDGILDIIVRQNGFEDGIGFETFLIWFKWNGQQYKEYRSTNIVRNFKTYLDEIRQFILTKNWKNLLSTAITQVKLRSLNRKGLNNIEISKRIFRPIHTNYSVLELENIIEVIFPEILENPFDLNKSKQEFEVSLRIEDINGDAFLYQTRIIMAQNPFTKQQFTFQVH